MRIQSAGIGSFGSLENLVNAYSTLYRYLKDNYDDTAKLKKYWGYWPTTWCSSRSPPTSAALKIFETINERGVGLNPMDLLKNLLFTQVKQAQFPSSKTNVEEDHQTAGKEKGKPLRFLRYFLMANYVIRTSVATPWCAKTRSTTGSSTKDNAALCDYANKPFEFVLQGHPQRRALSRLLQRAGNDGKPSLAMDSLKRLAGGCIQLTLRPCWLAAVLKPLFDHFVAQLESFLFYYIFTKTPTKRSGAQLLPMGRRAARDCCRHDPVK